MSQALRPAVLFVQLEPPPALLEEFHAWYDTEHVPERARIPGFLTTVRLVCPDAWPAYAGFYDLEHAGILGEHPYRSISGENASAWSRRLLPKMVGYDRLLLEQVSDGGRPLAAEHRGVVILRFSGDRHDLVVSGAARLAEATAGGQHRVFRRLETSASETVLVLDAPALELVPEWSAVELRAALGEAASGLRGIWRYVRYSRQGS